MFTTVTRTMAVEVLMSDTYVFDTMEDKLEWLKDFTQVIVLKNDNILYINF